ncbi:DNA repair exonuclease SbcCD nuclease subunit [Planctomycetales bacterium 10988]|nr:DNA repair exonuclease SbcCD nuclease subunit [Planctomycetales bacterium 10988]
MFKFIHCADIHIDSPLRGLEAYEAAPVERLRQATRQAFARMVELACEERVDFVVLAGDLFDGDWREMNTGLWVAQQFRILQQAKIPVFLIRGNHDAASEVTRRLRWPENVYEFSTRQPESFTLDELGVSLHGQGFATRDVRDNLVERYPEPRPGFFNLGLLHTSLGGHPDHNTYAPASVQDLLNKGYDYWALGHIHQREVHATAEKDGAWIVYAGNTQGRHIRETGAKGCYLIEVNDREASEPIFLETDVARWEVLRLELQEEDDLTDLYERFRRELSLLLEEHSDRLLVLRVIVCGACKAHETLFREHREEEAVAELRNLGNEYPDCIWIEKVLFETRPPIDLQRLRQGEDLFGDLLRSLDLAQGKAPHSASEGDAKLDLSEALAGLLNYRDARTELRRAGVDLEDPQQLRAWLAQVESLLIAHLVEEDA